ncbi:MAG: hypothetical protein PHS95_02370 [Candidatus Pacebacteria bacterium]|nr:hypothetical protein [Candidatus Paceibacterota bacterium]
MRQPRPDQEQYACIDRAQKEYIIEKSVYSKTTLANSLFLLAHAGNFSFCTALPEDRESVLIALQVPENICYRDGQFYIDTGDKLFLIRTDAVNSFLSRLEQAFLMLSDLMERQEMHAEDEDSCPGRADDLERTEDEIVRLCNGLLRKCLAKAEEKL